MADPKLNIGIETTADTAGIEKAKDALKSLGDEAQQTSRIIDATGSGSLGGFSAPAGLVDTQRLLKQNAEAAAFMNGNLVAAEKDINAASKAASGYAAALNVLGRSIGGIIGRKLTNDVGIEGVGRAIEPVLGKALAGLAGGGAGEAAAAGIAAEGAAAVAAEAGVVSFGVALAGVVAAGAAVIAAGPLLEKYFNNQALEAENAGRAFDDYIAKRNKAIIDAPTTGEATKDAFYIINQEIDALNARIKAGTTDEVFTGINLGVKHLSDDAKIAKGQVEALTNSLNDLAERSARDRDTRPRTDKENADIAKVQQEFNKAAYDALPPLLQQAQAAQNLDSYIKKAKDDLAHLTPGTGPDPGLLASAKTAQDLINLLDSAPNKGGATLIAGFAKGAQSLEDALQKAKDASDKILQAEVQDQSDAAQKIADDQQKLIALGVSQGQVVQALSIRNGEVAKGKNAGAQAALRALAYDKETGKVNEEIKKLTDDILANQLEIEASKKRQADADKLLRDFNEQLKIQSLSGEAQGQVKDITATLDKLKKVAPESADDQQNVADNIVTLRKLLKQIKDGAELAKAGDTDNPFGASAGAVAAATSQGIPVEGPLLPGQVRQSLGASPLFSNTGPGVHPSDASDPFGAALGDVSTAVSRAQADAASLAPVKDGLDKLNTIFATSAGQLIGIIATMNTTQEALNNKIVALEGQVADLAGQVEQ